VNKTGNEDWRKNEIAPAWGTGAIWGRRGKVFSVFGETDGSRFRLIGSEAIMVF
jgi:hypothetical protein